MLSRLIIIIFFFGIQSAFAWYFPEHAVIAEEGIRLIPDLSKKVLSRNYEQLLILEKEKFLKLCPKYDAEFLDISRKKQENCIPFNSLAALAGDHASFPGELKEMLFSKNKEDTGLGLRIVQGAQDHWKEVLILNPKIQSDATRRSLTRKLDIFLTLVDDGYLTRSQDHSTHFAPSDEQYSKVINDLVENGRIDNLINQFIVHHLRSLQYALLSRKPEKDQQFNRWMAFLEHAFALHFLQDGFASGHIVMFDNYLNPESNFNRLMRHDYFNRNGLVVARVRSPLSCSFLRVMGEKSIPGVDDPKSICWTTFGDGFLNKTDGLDLKWAASAVSTLETLFAMAFEPESFKPLTKESACSGKDSQDLEEVFSNINPFKPWSIGRESRREKPWDCFEKRFILKKSLDALSYLEKTPLLNEVNANSNKPVLVGVASKRQIGLPFGGCVNIQEWDVDKDSTEITKKYCSENTALNLGKPDVSLISNVLTSMPIPQADKKELYGSDPFSSSLSSEFMIGFPLLQGFGNNESTEFGINFQFGIAYRLEYVIASNPNFGAAEFLVGVYNAAQYKSGQTDALTVGNYEFRSALPNFGLDYLFKKIYFGLFKKNKPSYKDIVGQFDFTYSFISSFRYYNQLIENSGRNRFRAWDIEVFTLNLPLNDEIRGLERISRIPSQIRLRAGEDLINNAFMIGIEFTVGFSRSF